MTLWHCDTAILTWSDCRSESRGSRGWRGWIEERFSSPLVAGSSTANCPGRSHQDSSSSPVCLSGGGKEEEEEGGKEEERGGEDM